MTGPARVGGRPLPRPRDREGPRRRCSTCSSGRSSPSGLVFAWRTVIVSIVLGTVVTRAREPPARVPRDARAADRRCARGVGAAALALRALRARRSPSSSASSALALVVLRGVLRGTASRPARGCSLLAVGVLGLFIGVAMVAPSLARPLASVLGRPATVVGGVAGDLARSNSMRNPSRTASTAAALMIGLALVTVVAVLAQGLKCASSRAPSSRSSTPTTRSPRRTASLPTGVDSTEAIRRSGVATVVAGVRAGDGRAFGKTIQVTGVEPEHLADDRDSTGRRARTRRSTRLGANGAIADKGYAKTHHLVVGSPIRLETPGGRVPRPAGDGDLRPAARRLAARAGDDLVAGLRLGLRRTRRTSSRFVNMPGGVTAANTAKLERVLARSPTRRSRPRSSSSRTRRRA